MCGKERLELVVMATVTPKDGLSVDLAAVVLLLVSAQAAWDIPTT